MFHPKFRSILASAALVSTLSLMSVQTVSAAPRAARAHVSGAFSERIERWGSLAWSLLTSLWEKRSSIISPEGLPHPEEAPGSSSAGGD